MKHKLNDEESTDVHKSPLFVVVKVLCSFSVFFSLEQKHLFSSCVPTDNMRSKHEPFSSAKK